PEVAANDQTPGLLRGDATRTQVEQVDVLQASAGTGVSGALDLTGEDLQVRYRVDPGPVRELQVAVVLVGVGAVGAFTDDHITDPDRVSALAAQRTLVVHPGAGVGPVVVDERTVLVVLLVTGEVEPVQLGATASAAVGHLRRQTHQITAQGDDDRLESGVLADHRVVLADLHGVVVPLLQADQGEVGALSDVDVQAAGTHTGAGVADDHGGLGHRLDVEDQLLEGRPTQTLAVDGDRLVGRRRARNRDDGRRLEGAVCLGDRPVRGVSRGTEPFVVTADLLDGDALGGVDGQLVLAVCGTFPVLQALEAAQRCETPLLLAAVGDGKVVDVVGTTRAEFGDRDLSEPVAVCLRLNLGVGQLSPPTLPSGVRSDGSAPARIPSGARVRWVPRSLGPPCPWPLPRAFPYSSSRRVGPR